MKSRAWAFTLNNYSDADETALQTAPHQRYLVYGYELAPDTGTPHLQGYINFKHPVALSWLKRHVHAAAHWEQAKASASINRDYCTKSGSFKEFGEIPLTPSQIGQKEQERWLTAKQAAKEGRFDDIPPDIYIRYLGNIHRLHSLTQTTPPADPNPDFRWYWGPTGSGKSRSAREEFPKAYIKNPNKWWDGFQPGIHEEVIIDEWDPSMEKHGLGSMLKRWADHHPFAAEVKGGSMIIRPHVIIITSNYCMDDCFDDTRNLDPLRRRFTIREFRHESS